MERLQKVISVIEIDFNSTENKLKDKEKEIEELQQENATLKTNLFEAGVKENKLISEIKNLTAVVEHYENERADFMEKYNVYSDDLQKVSFSNIIYVRALPKNQKKSKKPSKTKTEY